MYKNHMSYVKKYWSKFVNREIITYTFAGIMTTIVNFIVYYLLCNVLEVENLIANTIAWVVAVSFAYIVNALWVFQSERESIWKESMKIIKFFGARILSFFVEQLGMLLFVNELKFNNLIVKAFLTVVVIVLNYLFSKAYIFRKQKDKCLE
ncbi:GtrA family protein [Anaerocolumna sp.]|uniref:GtrA family protein n=1 Tax=Anaerocolumna sp. TaxID=2041569 RepID=UPI0028A8DE25|nr:GtrA family protein [Anaerocolumna sp.]